MECQCYLESKDYAPGFQKLIDLKNAGLVIYRHTTHIEDIETKTGNVKYAVGTAEDIYILHNTSDKDVSSADYWPEIEQNTTKCPRCIAIKEQARMLLMKGPTIRGNTVMGICDHCKMKVTPCCVCQEVVKSFVPSKLERTDVVGKEKVKLWLGKIKFLLDDKSKDKKLDHFDINTVQLCPNLRSEVSEPIVEQLFGPHKFDSDSTIQPIKDKKKPIHFSQLEQLEHPILFKDPLKKSGMSSLGNDDWEFSDSDISKSMLHAQPKNVTHSIIKYTTEPNNRKVVAPMQTAAKFEDIFKDAIRLSDSKQTTTTKMYGDVPQVHGRDRTDFEPTEIKQSSITAKDRIEKTSFKPDKQATKDIYGRSVRLPDDNGQWSNEASLNQTAHLTKVKDSHDGRQRQNISTDNLVTKVKDITKEDLKPNSIIFPQSFNKYPTKQKSSSELIKDTALRTRESIVKEHKQAKQQSDKIYINKIPDEITDTDNIEKVRIEKNSSNAARKGQKTPDLAEKTQKDAPKATLKVEKNAKTAEKESQQAKKDAQKAALLAEKESQQAKKDAQKAALIAEKNAKAAQKESQQAKKDAQKAALIAEKNAKAAEKESQQAKKDAQKAALIAEKNAKAAEKEQAKKDAQKAALEKNAKAAEKEQAKKDAQKAALIIEKNAKAAEKEQATLDNRQAQNDALKAASIAEKNAAKAEKSAAKTDKGTAKTDKGTAKTEKDTDTQQAEKKAQKSHLKSEKNASKAENDALQAKKDAQKAALITEKNAKAAEKEQATPDNRQSQNDALKAASIAEKNAAKAEKSAAKTEKGTAKTEKDTDTQKAEKKAQKSALISEKNATKAENDALQAEKDARKANYDAQREAEKAELELSEKSSKEKPRKDDKIIKVSCDSVIERTKPQNKKDNNRMKHANLVKASSPGNLIGTDGETVMALDDLISKLVKLKQLAHEGRLHHTSPDLRKTQKYMEVHCAQHTHQKNEHCLLCTNSDIALEFASLCPHNEIKEELSEMIVGQHILKFRPLRAPTDDVSEEKDTEEHVEKPLRKAAATPETGNCYWRYSLSNREFIDNGWTQLPTEKVVRKMNVYRMRPARPEFDWFEHNKKKGKMKYDTGEKLAEFDDNGRGRWFYRNGRMALVYYDAEEQHAGQRFVIYSNGEPDERGRSRPYALLATFDYLGNGIVFDHGGKIRLKYNQTEGVVLDRSIGPVSHWKWHTLNDPPVLQQVMIDTQIPHKDPMIMNLGKPGDDKPRKDDEDMLAIEFDNILKEKSKKLSQAFRPFQIKMKALKINEHFSLRVLDQASVYLLYRDGKTNLKLNIGMVLDNKEIVDTDTADLGDVSNNLEKLPARTESLAGLQKSIAIAQQYDKMRTERERKLHIGVQNASIDKLIAGISRPIPRQLITTVSSDSPIISADHCKCNRKPNVYYDTRFF